MCISVELKEAVDYTEKINLYCDGKVSSFLKNNNKFEEIIVGYKEMIKDAHDMPAFGVSLNKETLKAINSGIWVEFQFDKRFESNGLPYEKLLINVNESYSGFNIIRYNSGYGYDGRCFYFDLVNKNMTDFYNILLK